MPELPYRNNFPWVCPDEPAAVDLGGILGRPAWTGDYTARGSNLFGSFSTSWKTAKAILANYHTLRQNIKEISAHF